MTDEDEHEGTTPHWMKHIRWSHSGLPLLDERINGLASLWADGSLAFRELVPEIQEAIRSSTGRGGNLRDYARNISTAAQWMAFVDVIHFCAEHKFTSAADRIEAFRWFEKELSTTGPAIGAPDRSWIADVCEFRSQTEEVDDPMHQLVRRWVAGQDIESHEDLIEQSIATRRPIQQQRRAHNEAPERAVSLWVASLRADVQGLVLRETDAYCRANELAGSSERTRAWREMLDVLQKPPRGHGF